MATELPSAGGVGGEGNLVDQVTLLHICRRVVWRSSLKSLMEIRVEAAVALERRKVDLRMGQGVQQRNGHH
jgi:hypothetical protein